MLPLCSASSSAWSISGSALSSSIRPMWRPASCSAAFASWSLRPAARAASSARCSNSSASARRPIHLATRARRSRATNRPSWSSGSTTSSAWSASSTARANSPSSDAAVSDRAVRALVCRSRAPSAAASSATRVISSRTTGRSPSCDAARAARYRRSNVGSSSKARSKSLRAERLDSRASARLPAVWSARAAVCANSCGGCPSSSAYSVQAWSRWYARISTSSLSAFSCSHSAKRVWYSARLDLERPPYATWRIITCLKRYADSPLIVERSSRVTKSRRSRSSSMSSSSSASYSLER